MTDEAGRGAAKRAVAAAVSGIGVLFAIPPLVHLADHHHTLPSFLTAVAFPLCVAVSIVYGGIWLSRSDLDPPHLVTVLRWTAVGIGGLALVAAFLVVHQWAEGDPIHEPAYVVANTAVVGAVGGFVLGVHGARTRQHRARARRNERRFRRLFEGTLDSLLIADDDGTYVDVNPAACELLATPKEELVGRSIAEFVDESSFEPAWSSFLEEGEMRGELRVVDARGNERIVDFAATANVYDGHHLSALRDVSDRHEHERLLEAEREKLEFLNQLLRHHVLNGMNLIIAKATVTGERVDEPESRGDLQSIVDRSTEIVSLVSRIRRLVRSTAGETPQRPVNLSEVLERELSAFRCSYPEATVETEGIGTDRFVSADRMIAEVVSNLLETAVEHSEDPSPSIHLGVRTRGGRVVVTIADDGPGIPPERREELLGKGSRGVKSPGTGFGLSIAAMLVESYGGTIRIEDDQPTGAVFVVELPRGDPDGAETPGAFPEPDAD